MGRNGYALMNLWRASWQGEVSAGDVSQRAREKIGHPRPYNGTGHSTSKHKWKRTRKSGTFRWDIFFFYVKNCIPTASAPEFWPSRPFISFSSEVSSMDSCCILKTPTLSLYRMIEKFQRTLITCFHTLVITTKNRVGEHHPEPVYANKCSCVFWDGSLIHSRQI